MHCVRSFPELFQKKVGYGANCSVMYSRRQRVCDENIMIWFLISTDRVRSACKRPHH